MNSFKYCQSQIEDNSKCKTQCEHCKEYFKPLEIMNSYENEIMAKLQGDTPKQKYDDLCEMFKRLEQNNEVFNEVVGLYSKQYDDEECGIHFKQRMRFLIDKYQS